MKAYVAVGANLGKPLSSVTRAIRKLDNSPSTKVARVSPLYETEPVGGPHQPNYVNGVLEVNTRLSPAALMRRLLFIEQQLGRERREKWGPRLIDLDLLTYGRRVIRRPGLTVPHPRYHKRRFVLVPFCDLNPRFVHPTNGRQNQSLLRKLTPQGQRVTILAQWNGTRFSPSKKKRSPKSRS